MEISNFVMILLLLMLETIIYILDWMLIRKTLQEILVYTNIIVVESLIKVLMNSV